MPTFTVIYNVLLDVVSVRGNSLLECFVPKNND